MLKWSDNVMHNYAITAHKAQGSTYENVILIEEDLDRNKKIVERNRIKYTAYTRAKNKLFILK
jgi:ATP-dependent exoDNAse (exonuclease V) alpha subunit